MPYIPEKGDIIRINFNPQSGREQAGRRPALVISPTVYNRRVKPIIVCPITTKIKGYPLEVRVPEGLAVSGVILADQIKSLDYQTRQAEAVGNFTVFNIKGNKYRLIVDINYSRQTIFVKYILSHAEYDKENWKNDPYF